MLSETQFGTTSVYLCATRNVPPHIYNRSELCHLCVRRCLSTLLYCVLNTKLFLFTPLFHWPSMIWCNFIEPEDVMQNGRRDGTPAGTRRNNNVFTTSTRRRRRRVDVVKTLSLRHYWVMCPLGRNSAALRVLRVQVYNLSRWWKPLQSLDTHDLKITISCSMLSFINIYEPLHTSTQTRIGA